MTGRIRPVGNRTNVNVRFQESESLVRDPWDEEAHQNGRHTIASATGVAYSGLAPRDCTDCSRNEANGPPPRHDSSAPIAVQVSDRTEGAQTTGDS